MDEWLAGENPMVRDECWPEYKSNYTEDEGYWEWVDAQIDQARDK